MTKQAATRSFQAKSQVKNMWLALVLVGGAITCASLAEQRVSGASTLFAVALMMAIWSRRASLVRLYEEHFEMKFAPLAPLRKILYRDIRKVEPLGKQRIRLTYAVGEREQSVKVPLNMLDDQEGQELAQLLSSHAA